MFGEFNTERLDHRISFEGRIRKKLWMHQKKTLTKHPSKFWNDEVLDPECFYKLEKGNLKEDLKVDSYGLRMVLMKEIENFNKKGVEIEDIELGGPLEELIVEKIQNALKKSGSIKY